MLLQTNARVRCANNRQLHEDDHDTENYGEHGETRVYHQNPNESGDHLMEVEDR